jgi:NADH-quinone oxidoreductase subunit G
MDTILINSQKFTINIAEKNYLIYQYCTQRDIELPCFCYNEKLEIAGNCRICLVEIEKMAKLMLACSTKIENGMSIKTNTLRVRKVRKSIIEFLLINHPLDCPVCDQAGECDLQDITHKFGLHRGRFYEYSKRSIIDKDSYIFLKTILTRCIHCTRCIRFYKEIEGQTGFSFLNRGENTEIVLNKVKLLSILSGNVVDICPVGALTSKIHSFRARPWEYLKYETIDILDSMCSSICLDIRNNRILRILPISDSYWNSDWITNITRYFFDGLSIQRLDNAYLNLNKTILSLNWVIIIKIIIKTLLLNLFNNKGLKFIINKFLDLESCYLLKKINNNFGYLNIFLQKKFYNNFDKHFYFFFNSEFSNLKSFNNFFFLGINLRIVMPLLNSLLRQLIKKKFVKIFTIGNIISDISFNIINLGNNFLSFIFLLEQKSKFNLYYFYSSFFLSNFKKFIKGFIKYKAILIGENFFFFKQAYKIISKFISTFNYKLNMIYVLFVYISKLHYQELNLKNNTFLNNKFFYNLDFEYNIKKKKSDFSIIQTTNFFNSISFYNLIIPTSNFFEYKGLYINLAGRFKKKYAMYQFNNNLKSNEEIFRFIYLNQLNFKFNWTLIFKFFSNLFSINWDYFEIFYFQNIYFKYFENKEKIFNYSITFYNYLFFDFTINIYKMHSLYKFSLILQQAYYNLQNYIIVCEIA